MIKILEIVHRTVFVRIKKWVKLISMDWGKEEGFFSYQNLRREKTRFLNAPFNGFSGSFFESVKRNQFLAHCSSNFRQLDSLANERIFGKIDIIW